MPSGFKPGESGNKRGRPPKHPALAMRCRAVTNEVVDFWLKTLRAKGERMQDRLEASKLLMAYGHGKPTQGVTVSAPDGGPVKLEVDADAKSILGDPGVRDLLQAAALRAAREGGDAGGVRD